MRQITLVIFVLLFINNAAMAAGNTGMSEEQMQRMQQQALEMQQCMADIDQSAMQELMARGKQLESEVKQLCADGKRDQARQKAIEYGQEVSNSEEMQAIRKCGEMALIMSEQVPMESYGEGDNRHICDEL